MSLFEVNLLLKNNRYNECVSYCLKNNLNLTAKIISKVHAVEEVKEEVKNEVTMKELVDTRKKVMLLTSWADAYEIAKLWNKMSPKGNYGGEKFRMVWEGEPDYYIIINAPLQSNIRFNPKKSIIFRMEPNMSKNPHIWKEWANPDSSSFLRVEKHEDGCLNIAEWHLSWSYDKFNSTVIEKDESKADIVSTVLSEKYYDPGHVKRIDFVKYAEKKLKFDVFGNNKWNYLNYKGKLPYHCKDNALFPYKYTFNVENQFVNNYFTEKLIDGLMAECLVFYHGCPNIREIIDPRAYVYLELSNFEADCALIEKAIKEDWWKERLPYIKQAKKKVMNELTLFSRVDKLDL